MAQPRLLIRKGMMQIQGRNRPCVQVLAVVDPDIQAVLMEHFVNENLFKRSSYAMGLPAGAPAPSPSLAPHFSALIKNDACPEITVKTILAAQLHQASSIWEAMAFEYIAKRAFDSLVEIVRCVSELKTETVYLGPDRDQDQFAADTAAEVAAQQRAAA